MHPQTRSPAAGPVRHRPWAAVLAGVLLLAVVQQVAAQKFADDPVEKFRDALRLEQNRRGGFLQGKALEYALAFRKENLNRAVHGELGECLDMEAAHHIRTGQTEDHREAAKAFVEKRPPTFSGR